LSYSVTENDLQDLFAQHGPVAEVNLMLDKFSGRPRGFAFVTMATPDAANAAIQALNGKEFSGRNLTVNEARPREERPPRSGGGFGGGGGGGRRPRRY
jgi:RNA recognition motif-containing protein